jgi:DNA topoisomerase-1
VLEEKKALKGIKVSRIIFHEITKTAIQDAISHPRDLDQSLVNAYLARRSLDYLVGFGLSPVLWRKLPGARSAGRVQSVALRLIVERELSILSFISQEYWSIHGLFLTSNHESVKARLTHFNKEKLEKFSIEKQEQAQSMVASLVGLSYHVEKVEKRQVRRQPAAPFITSTLQQEASRKLGFGASRTMRTAQKLYEGISIKGEMTGLITYMRTDSTHLSLDALKDIRSYLLEIYGKDYVPNQPREFKKKVKNAQEAHEAIRPTQVSLKPQDIESYVDRDQYLLYDLIWKRTLSSQMEQAVFDQVSLDIVDENKENRFRATGSTLVFDGFLRVYQEGKDEESSETDEDSRIPLVKENDALNLKNLEPLQHFTQPQPRFTEASLVKHLEELGIGRPSTYASLIQVLQDRGYVRIEKRQFIPEDIGYLVTIFLTLFFERYVQYDFTANM